MLLGGGLVLAGLAVDTALRYAYERMRPQLEADLGLWLGHPLRFGDYRGFDLSGVRIGPSRLLPVAADRSSVAVSGLSLSLDPLASLRQGLPVLHLGLREPRADLHRNASGGYWRLGPEPPPPKVDIRLRLLQPARLRVHPLGLDWRLGGDLALQPHRGTLRLRARLRPAGAVGVLEATAQSGPDRGGWRLTLASHRFPVTGLARLLALPGELRGRADGRAQLLWQPGRRDCRGRFATHQLSWRPGPAAAAARSPGPPPSLELAGLQLICRGDRLEVPALAWRWGSQRGSAALRSRFGPEGLRLEPLELRQGSSALRLAGSLQPRPRLTGRWQSEPGRLPGFAPIPPALRGGRLQGELRLSGSWSQPRLAITARQAANPLIGPWEAALSWQERRLRLERFNAAQLQARGSLPLALSPAGGLASGDLDLWLNLERYPLQRFNRLVGTRLQGRLDAVGTVRGPLAALQPELRLLVDQPAAGPLALAERWQGDWTGAPDGGALVRLEALAPATPGSLRMRLDRRWLPREARLERGAGRLELAGSPSLYRWRADGLPLDGLQVALGPRGRRQPLQGRLSGRGQLGLEPLALEGRVELERPVALGVMARRARFEGRYGDRAYQVGGSLEPTGGGQLELSWRGRWQGPFQARIQARQVGDAALRQLAQAWPRWRGEPPPPSGQASDLGALLIDRLGGSLDAQLQALARARQQLEQAVAQRQQGLTPLQRLAGVAARVDGDLRLAGPDLGQARADLEARAQLWRPGVDQDEPLGEGPLRLRFSGPLQAGAGDFAVEGLSLALLSLLTPVPEELRGSLQATGRYRLQPGQTPQLALALGLSDGRLGERGLSLERGQLELAGDQLRLDLALRAAGAASSVDLAGVVPIDPAAEGLELRLSSRDDGLRFLGALAEPALTWQKGSGDLQLLVRGSLARPIANGFLRFRGAELLLAGQQVRDLEAVALFDFEDLELQELSARVGARGRITGAGHLRLFSPAPDGAASPTSTAPAPGLQLRLEAVPIAVPRLRAVADGQLQVGGTLLAMRFGGQLGIGRGTLNVEPGQLEPAAAAPAATSVAQLLESRWDFQQPLVLVGAEVQSDASEALAAALPRVPVVGFDNLRLNLGPDLVVGVPRLASFATGGSLRLNGHLDPSLRVQGVVRLLRGRLNLFTTTFNLDPQAPNVAVFTPSMGLIPYLDIALRTRLSDSVNGAASLPGGTVSLQEIEAVETNTLDQLNLVRVFLSVSGPADRLAQNLRLRSSPPLPEDRLLALIGGNSLLGIAGANAGAALATALGQSLLSPLLGTLSDAFGQRLSFALYPAYVNQSVSNGQELRSGRVPPQLVLGSEIGLDITERFNASVLAAPNRSDIPPQFNLNVKASERLNLQGSIDSQGAWQTQLQVFFRF